MGLALRMLVNQMAAEKMAADGTGSALAFVLKSPGSCASTATIQTLGDEAHSGTASSFVQQHIDRVTPLCRQLSTPSCITPSCITARTEEDEPHLNCVLHIEDEADNAGIMHRRMLWRLEVTRPDDWEDDEEEAEEEEEEEEV